MILNTLFNWMYGDEEQLYLSNQVLTEEQIEYEHIDARKTNKVLLAEARVDRLNAANATGSVQKLERHRVFMSYLEFCKQGVTNSLFLNTIRFFLTTSQSDKTQLIPKINQLFFALLQTDEEGTLAFYKENQALFKGCTDIAEKVDSIFFEQNIVTDVQQIKIDITALNSTLFHQKNTLGIIELCREWVGDTEQFAVLMLWLLQRKLSAEQILQTHLLHDFLSYHLFSLHSKYNEVTKLYTLLSHFPEATELVNEAKKTASDERGHEKYALNGVVAEGDVTLKKVEPKPSSLQFTMTTANFLALHQLFGTGFLLNAILTSVEHNKTKWLDLLKDTLNQPKISLHEVAGYINHVARHASPLVLKNLADYLDEAGVQQLFANNEGAVFFLLHYKPKFLAYINQNNVTAFIDHITAEDVPGTDIIYQLLALFKMLLRIKHPSTQLVFITLIDNLASYPYLLEEDELSWELKKYPDGKLVLTQRCELLLEGLNNCIKEQIATLPFSADNYHLIEDNWVAATRKLDLFAQINSQIGINAQDKYALQARIVAIAMQHHGDQFDLTTFFEAFSLPALIQEDEVNQYERLLIELLVSIDNGALRTQVIELLENGPVKRLNWMEKEYEGKTVLIRAAKSGNLGLITLIESKITLKMGNKAVVIAAKEKQWNVVDYLCKSADIVLKQEELIEVISLAVAQGQLGIIKQLFDSYDYKPSSTEMGKFLTQAITNNQFDAVSYLYSCEFNMPKQAVIEKLCKLAVQLDFWDIALFIVHAKKNAPPQPIIERLLEQAASDLKLDALQALNQFQNYKFRVPVMQRIMVKACQLGHLPIVTFIHDLPADLALKLVIDNGLKHAVLHKHMDIVHFLCASSTRPPSQTAINQELKNAVKKENEELVALFCSLTANKSTDIAIRESLLLAVSIKSLDMVTYFCTNKLASLNQYTISEALVLAVKHKMPEIVYQLCELPKFTPLPKLLKKAFDKALASGQTEVSDYLRSRLPVNFRHHYHENSQRKNRPNDSVGNQLDNHGLFRRKKGNRYQVLSSVIEEENDIARDVALDKMI